MTGSGVSIEPFRIEQMLDIGDMAELFKCSKATVTRRVELGELPYPTCGTGQSARWYPPAVREWLEKRSR